MVDFDEGSDVFQMVMSFFFSSNVIFNWGFGDLGQEGKDEYKI